MSTEQFLDLARRSGAVDPRRLETHVAKAGPLPEDAAEAAEQLVSAGLITKYQAEPLLAGKPQRFLLCGKYRILDRLGAGGMASVFLCEHKIMRRRVAIKMLPPKLANNPSMLDRFHREARAIASVHHANIVGAHDVDADGNVHFLVMEFVEGTNFHELVRRSGPLAIERAAHYIAQCAIGLQHAHDKGLVHRDIKPANLLLDRTGTVKILDLGLALVFHADDDNLTMEHDANSILGTAEYLAPEQAVDSHNVDHRADIYSLGLTLYFLLTAQTPYGEGSTAQKLIWHQLRSPKPIRDVRPDVPEDLWAVIQKMLAKAPTDRYQSAREVFQALAPWTANPIALPTEAEMPKSNLPAIDGGAVTDAGYGADAAASFGPGVMALPSPLDLAAGGPSTGGRSAPTRPAASTVAPAVDFAPIDLAPPPVDLAPSVDPAPSPSAPAVPATPPASNPPASTPPASAVPKAAAVVAAPPASAPAVAKATPAGPSSIKAKPAADAPVSVRAKAVGDSNGPISAKARAADDSGEDESGAKSGSDLTGPASGKSKKRKKKDEAEAAKKKKMSMIYGGIAGLVALGGVGVLVVAAMSDPPPPKTPPIVKPADNKGTPAPSPTPKPPTKKDPPTKVPATYEAEAAEQASGMHQDSASASGKKRVGYIDGKPGHSVTFRVGVPTAGDYRVKVWYSSGQPGSDATIPKHRLSVNGRTDEEVVYKFTGDWDKFETLVLDVYFHEGTNTLEFKSNGPPADLDKIEVLPPDPSGPKPPDRLVKVTSDGTATASGEDGNNRAGLAFDGNPKTKWAVKARTGSLTYQFSKDAAHAVQHYRLTSAADTPERDPKNWVLEGSNDGKDWFPLDNPMNQKFTGRGTVKVYNVLGNTRAFKQYRLNIKANNGADTTQLAELALYAEPVTAPPPMVEPPKPDPMPTPPPMPTGPTVTPEFYPTKPREVFFDLAVPSTRANVWNVVRQKWAFKESAPGAGEVAVSAVQQRNATGPGDPKPTNVQDGNRPLGVLQVRTENGELQVGVPQGKNIMWEPILKIGAKKGDTWTRTLPNGNKQTYTLVDVGPRAGKPSATVTTETPHPSGGTLKFTHVYVEGVGEVERKVDLEARGGGKVVPVSDMRLVE